MQQGVSITLPAMPDDTYFDSLESVVTPTILRIDTKALRTALTALTSIAGVKRSSLPILHHVYLGLHQDGLLHCRRTDLDAWAEATVPVDVVGALGDIRSTTVLAKAIFDGITGTSAREVLLRMEKKQTRLSVGAGTMTLPTLPVEEFPIFCQAEKLTVVGSPVELIADDMRQLGRTTFAATLYGNGRPVFECMHIAFSVSGIEAACADSFRLATQKVDVQVPEDMQGKATLIRADKYIALVKALPKEGTFTWTLYKDADLTLEPGNTIERWILGISCETWTAFLMVQEGVYPNYDAIVAYHEDYVFDIDRQGFLEALHAAKPTAKESANIVRLHFDWNEGTEDHRLTVETISDNKTVFCYTVPDAITVLQAKDLFPLVLFVNIAYLIDALSVITAKSCTMRLKSPKHVFSLEDPNNWQWLYMCMPMHGVR